LRACQRLEADEKLSGSLRFNRQDMKLFVNDRMLAPNTERLTDSLQGELRDFFESVVGDGEFEMKFDSNPRSLFGVEVRTAKLLELDEVLARLS